jgi:hypothetical protein
MGRDRDGKWIPGPGELISFDLAGRNADVFAERGPDLPARTPEEKPEKDHRH